MIRKLWAASAAFLMVTFVASCGGGGGGGGGSEPVNMPQFRVETNDVEINLSKFGQAEPVVVNGSITGATGAVFAQAVRDTTESINVSVSIDGTASRLSITPTNPRNLTPGVHTTNIDVTICNDSACLSPIPGGSQRISVTYTVTDPGFEIRCRDSDGSAPMDILIHYQDLPDFLELNREDKPERGIDYRVVVGFDVDGSGDDSIGDIRINLRHRKDSQQPIGEMLSLTDLGAFTSIVVEPNRALFDASCAPQVSVEGNVLRLSLDLSMNDHFSRLNETTPIQVGIDYNPSPTLTRSFDFLVGTRPADLSSGSNRNIPDLEDDASPVSTPEVELNRVEVIFQ